MEVEVGKGVISNNTHTKSIPQISFEICVHIEKKAASNHKKKIKIVVQSVMNEHYPQTEGFLSKLAWYMKF